MNLNERDPKAHDFYCDEVLSGTTEIDVVCETERVLAFRHTRPMYQRHVVVIPKVHINSLITLDDDDLLRQLFAVLREVSSEVLREEGVCKVVTNLGEYQESKHLHFHVISRPLP